MQKLIGTTLPLRQRSASKGWHRERIQCRVEAHWDTYVRCNILPAGNRLCGLIRRTEGWSMVPLRLWADSSPQSKNAEEKKDVANILESLPPQHDIQGLPPQLVL